MTAPAPIDDVLAVDDRGGNPPDFRGGQANLPLPTLCRLLANGMKNCFSLPWFLSRGPLDPTLNALVVRRVKPNYIRRYIMPSPTKQEDAIEEILDLRLNACRRVQTV
jgi:hypothetical protein